MKAWRAFSTVLPVVVASYTFCRRTEKFRYDGEAGFFSVVTLKGHPLAGYRYWRLFQLENGDIVIQTGALEHDRSLLDEGLASVGGARDKQFDLWRDLMLDILEFSEGEAVEDSDRHVPSGREAPDLRDEIEELVR